VNDLPLNGVLIYLIRHGETDHNASGRLQGHLDVELSERGRSQAQAAAAHLAGRGVTVIYSSDLLRAKQTAAIIGERLGLEVKLDRRLREVDVGQCQDLLAEEIAERFPELIEALGRDRETARYPGGESIGEMADRAQRAIADIARAHPGGKVAVVAHGGPLRRLIHRALGAGPEAREQVLLHNCAIVGLDLSPPAARLILTGPV